MRTQKAKKSIAVFLNVLFLISTILTPAPGAVFAEVLNLPEMNLNAASAEKPASAPAPGDSIDSGSPMKANEPPQLVDLDNASPLTKDGIEKDLQKRELKTVIDPKKQAQYIAALDKLIREAVQQKDKAFDMLGKMPKKLEGASDKDSEEDKAAQATALDIFNDYDLALNNIDAALKIDIKNLQDIRDKLNDPEYIPDGLDEKIKKYTDYFAQVRIILDSNLPNLSFLLAGNPHDSSVHEILKDVRSLREAGLQGRDLEKLNAAVTKLNQALADLKKASTAAKEFSEIILNSSIDDMDLKKLGDIRLEVRRSIDDARKGLTRVRSKINELRGPFNGNFMGGQGGQGNLQGFFNNPGVIPPNQTAQFLAWVRRNQVNLATVILREVQLQRAALLQVYQAALFQGNGAAAQNALAGIQFLNSQLIAATALRQNPGIYSTVYIWNALVQMANQRAILQAQGINLPPNLIFLFP